MRGKRTLGGVKAEIINAPRTKMRTSRRKLPLPARWSRLHHTAPGDRRAAVVPTDTRVADRTANSTRTVHDGGLNGSTDVFGMAELTTDPNDPRLSHGVDTEAGDQNEVYLVLGPEERAKGFVRPYRDVYVHDACGVVTRMGRALSETYARQPAYYGATYCVGCRMHLPVAEFRWDADGQRVGS